MFKKKKDEENQIVNNNLEAEESLPYYDLFKSFDEIQARRKDVKILEISLRQNQILIIFEKDLIPLNAFDDLSNMVRKAVRECVAPKYSSIGYIGENPALIIDTHVFKSDVHTFSTTFQVLDDTINYIANKICRCPALEIVFSNQYIKCYLDKPGITLDDIRKYEEIFRLKGTLELFGQRPYLLLINDNFEE